MYLAIENVSKRYGSGNWALRNFTLNLGPGVLGLLGPNGAGKTTLMSILATITRATEGSVRWSGADIASSPDALRSTLTFPRILECTQISTRLSFWSISPLSKDSMPPHPVVVLTNS